VVSTAAYCSACGASVAVGEAKPGRKGSGEIFTHVPHPHIAKRKEKAPVAVAAEASDKRALDTYNDAEAVLHEAIQIQQHLAAQDELLSKLADRFPLRPGA